MGLRVWAAAAAMAVSAWTAPAKAAIHEITVTIQSPENAGRFTPYEFPIVNYGDLLSVYIYLPEPVAYENSAFIARLYGRTANGIVGIIENSANHGNTLNNPITYEVVAFRHLSLYSGPFASTSDPIEFYGYSVMSGVPEPATWAMMLIGLAGLGYVARRRRAAHGATNKAMAAVERTGLLAPQ